MCSDFERLRRKFKPKRCDAFSHAVSNISAVQSDDGTILLKSGFDFSFAGKRLRNVLAVFSDVVMPGANNCLAGIRDAIVSYSPNSVLYGAVSGFQGVLSDNFKEIGRNDIRRILNCGGYAVIGSGDLKIEDDDQLDAVADFCAQHEIDLIVVVGGDEKNISFMNLSDYFDFKGISTRVISIPSCINGRQKPWSRNWALGTDTVSKVCSGIIGDIQMSALSSAKSYHFVTISGTCASNALLECALKCQSSLTLIGEEIRSKRLSLENIADAVSSCVRTRKIDGRSYGVILLSDDILENAYDVRMLLREVFALRRESDMLPEDISDVLSPASLNALNSIPRDCRNGVLDCFSKSGCIDFSQMDAARILAEKTKEKLKDYYFDYKIHRIGSESLCAFPTNFDCSFAYNSGICAFLLGLLGKSGYVAGVHGLEKKAGNWLGLGIPLSRLLDESADSDGADSVMRKYSLDMNCGAFVEFRNRRTSYMLNDDFAFPGPVDYNCKEMDVPLSLKLSCDSRISHDAEGV